MNRTPPTPPHNGLTIVIDKPSRFDITAKYLLSGKPRQWMDEEILAPDYDLAHADIRDSSCNEPFLLSTKRLFLLGYRAAAKYNLSTSKHGYPAQVIGIPTTIAFYPQDCCDHRNIEGDDSSDEDESSNDRDIKDAAPTRRSNHRFWTMWHLRKALGYHAKLYTIIHPEPLNKLEIVTYPNLDKLYSELIGTESKDLYLDIETSRVHRCLTCVGLSTTSTWPTVYVLPVYLPSGELAYSNWTKLYRLLFTLIRNNRVVAHNASFDLFILRAFYKLPFPEFVYDTLLANHRLFPEIEKSLAHVIAQWTAQPYHKDVATEVYNTTQLHKMWEYNARDVYNLRLIKTAQLEYTDSLPGSYDSIAQANSMVVPYLENSLAGLPVDLSKLAATHHQLTKSQNVYASICALLSGKPVFNPGSALQCKKFFHDELHYPVIAKSDKPPYAPKLGKKEMYQLLLKHDNPLVKAVLKYRSVAKDASMLESELWTPQ